MKHFFAYRKINLLLAVICILAITASCHKKPEDKPTEELTDNEIRERIRNNRFLEGAEIPGDIHQRLGASHVAGKYYLTSEPFLIEGCKTIQNLGLGVVKLWFQGNPEGSYPYNSGWNLEPNPTLVEIARHPYFKTVFDLPIQTFALSVRSQVNLKKAWEQPETDYSEEENATYQLAKYLFETYSDRDITFIFQNWEGDWLLRGGTGPEAQWTMDFYPDNVEKRCEVMTHWFKARQAGVTRAREEAGETECKIYHSIEVNKVMDCIKGIPGLSADVLPQVETDLVSWSAYDGMADPLNLWRGIDFIRENMKPTGAFPGTPVMIGEIGIPENQGTVFGIPEEEGEIVTEALLKRWDGAMAVFMAKDIPYVIQWEVYCNEPKDGVRDTTVRTRDELRGFWLIRPDKTESYCASYLKSLVQNAGGVISK